MATPEETRKRIKEMRERIFQEKDEVSADKNIKIDKQDIDLNKIKDIKKSRIPLQEEQSENHQKEDLSRDIQKNDDKISVLDTEIQKQVSELTVNFESKSNILKAEILKTIDGNFSENNKKLDGIEKRVNYNITNSSQTNRAFKERLEELNRALQLEIESIEQRLIDTNESYKKELAELSNSLKLEVSSVEKGFALDNQKVKKELVASSDKLSSFKNSIENRHHSLEKSFVEKLQQNDNKISVLDKDIQKQISELSLNFENKHGSLETEVLEKFEQTFSENTFRINAVEKLINDSITNVSELNKGLKERLNDLTSSLKLELSSVEQKLTSANQKVKTELKNKSDKLLEFDKSLEKQQKLMTKNLSEKLKQNDEKLSTLNSTMQKQISEIAHNLDNTSSTIETEFREKIEQMSINLHNVKEQIENQIGYLNTSMRGYILSVTTAQLEKIEAELLNSSEKALNFEKLITEEQHSLKDELSKDIQRNDVKISKLDSDFHKQVSELILDFKSKSNSLKAEIFKKIDDNFSTNISKIDGIEKLVNYNITNSSQTNKAFKERIEELNRVFLSEKESIEQRLLDANELHNKKITELGNSLELEVSSIEKRFTSANQKIEKELKTRSDEFFNLKKSVEKSHKSLEDSFLTKFHDVDDRISAVSTESIKNISEMAHNFANKTNTLETEIYDKLEHSDFQLKNLEEQIENQIGYLNTSLRGYVLSISTGQDEKINSLNDQLYLLQEQLQAEVSLIKGLVLEEKQLIEDGMTKYALEANKKIDAKADKIQNNVKSLKQELFEHHRDQKAALDKKLKASDLKNNDNLSKKIFEIRELLSVEINSLTQELNGLKDVVEERHSELTKSMDNSLSDIKETAEKDRENFNNQFEKVSKTIETVDSKIVKEDDLTELFQNYSLNVNILGNDNPKKG